MNEPIRALPIERFKRLYRIKEDFWLTDLIAGFSGTVFMAGGVVRDWARNCSPLIGKDHFTEYHGEHDPKGMKRVEELATSRDLTDIDCFFPDEMTLQRFKVYLMGKKFTEASSSNDRVLNMVKSIDENVLVVVQLVRMQYYATLEAVVDSFDLSPCMLGVDKTHVAFGRWTPKDIRGERMRVHRITYPLSTLRRVIKYAKKGFYACKGTLTEAAEALTDAVRRGDPNTAVAYVD